MLVEWGFALFVLCLFFLYCLRVVPPMIISSSHLSLNCEGRWGTTGDFATNFLHFSTALWDLVNSRPVHSLMLSSHLFLCLPCLLPSFTVSCKMVLVRPDERETWPYHCSLHLFMMVRKSSWGPVACLIILSFKIYQILHIYSPRVINIISEYFIAVVIFIAVPCFDLIWKGALSQTVGLWTVPAFIFESAHRILK